MNGKGKFSKVYAGAGAKVYGGISPFPSPAWMPPIGCIRHHHIAGIHAAISSKWFTPYWRGGSRHIGVVDTATSSWWIPPYWRDVLGVKTKVKTNEKLMKSAGAKKRDFSGEKRRGKRRGKCPLKT
jgi:hypothetical protein